jgi:pimeloyl-ACP methyl ester carboxylesterase
MKAFVSVSLIAAFLFGICAACSKPDNLPSKTYVIVHGAWQSPAIWDDVKKQLEAKGNHVVVVELPAHGTDTTSPTAVSIDVYRDKVIAAIDALKTKVILVGHSMGGVVVTATAEAIPSKIEKLVYIGAFLPADQQSLGDLAATDKQSLLGPALLPIKGGLLLDIVHDSIAPIFCQDGTTAQQQLVLDNYKPEPAIPFGNRVTITAARFGSVHKYYIHTLRDNAVGIDLQNRMAAAAKIRSQFSLNTGHCPFVTDVNGTVKLLLQIAAE